jgi:hypothetical protein
LGLSFSSVQSILTEDLGMKLSAKSVPNCWQSSGKTFALQQPEICSSMLIKTQTSWRQWLPVMNLGSKGTTQKQKSSQHYGRLQDLWGQKWHNKFRARWKWCWQFSLITKALFTMSMHQNVILLTRCTTLKFSIGCVMGRGAGELCCESEMPSSGIQHHRPLVPPCPKHPG